MYDGLFCADCDVACHPSCAGSVPNTCGLPAELAEHMAVQEEPSPKKLRSGEEEEVGRNKSGEETCMVDAAAKGTMSLVIKKEKMAMLRFVSRFVIGVGFRPCAHASASPHMRCTNTRLTAG